MATNTQQRYTGADEARRRIADVLDGDSLARLGPLTGDPIVERERLIAEVVSIADGQREPLEELRAGYQRRLHRASDDFEATDRLQVIEGSLTDVPRPHGDPPRERRQRWSRRGWWPRRRADLDGAPR